MAPTPEDFRRNARVSADDAVLWDKMADEAEARAKHFRQKAEERRSHSAFYARQAEIASAKINAEFADILGVAA